MNWEASSEARVPLAPELLLNKGRQARCLVFSVFKSEPGFCLEGNMNDPQCSQLKETRSCSTKSLKSN